jgi:hypothetical protein
MQHFPFAFQQLNSKSLLLETNNAGNRIANVSGYGYTPEKLKLEKLIKTYKQNGGVSEILYDGDLSVNYNHLYNTSFGSNTTGWSPYVNGGTVTNPAVTVDNGEMRIDTAGTYVWSGVVQSLIAIVANRIYTLTGFARGSIASWSLNYYLSTSNNPNGGVVMSNTRQPFSFTFLAGTGVPDLFLRTNSVMSTFWLDDIQLTDTATGQSVFLNFRSRTDNTTVKILNLGSAGASGDGTFVNENAHTMTVTSTRYSSLVNILPNSSFEDGTYREKNNGVTAYSLDNSQARTGLYSLLVQTNGTGFPGVRTHLVKVKPNTTYTASCYYKNPAAHVAGTNGNGFRLYYVAYDNSGGAISQAGAINDLTTIQNVWTRVTTTFTTTAATNWVDLSIYQYSNGTAYYDDFQLEESATATAYVNNQSGVTTNSMSFNTASSQYISTNQPVSSDVTAIFVARRTATNKMSLLGTGGGGSALACHLTFNGIMGMDKSYVIGLGTTGGSYAAQNDWNVYGYSFNNTTLQGKFYANGSLVGTVTGPQSVITAGRTVIFGSTIGGEEFFDGEMLHIAYRSAILTDSQVASISTNLKNYYNI